jgi:hypothetical protein
MISWNLKADVLDGYIIFVTGDPVTLGCWEPDMAVQLDPSIKSKNEWTAEIKVTPLLTEITSRRGWYGQLENKLDLRKVHDYK